MEGRPVRPARSAASVGGRHHHSVVRQFGRIGGFARRQPPLGTDPWQCALSAPHRRAGGRGRPARKGAWVLAVDRRSDHAVQPGGADRIPNRSPAHRSRRRHRRACHRRADRAGSAATNHRSRRRRGSRHPWPDHPRPHRQQHRSPCGASALQRGAQKTRGPHQADAAARTGRQRARPPAAATTTSESWSAAPP